MILLFVDDEPENVAWTAGVLRDALGAQIRVAATVEEAVEILHAEPVDLLITDIFIPMGARPGGALGPRAAKKAEQIEHLGGLVLLDELDRLPGCDVLVHTACVDRALLEVLGARQVERVRKPAPPDVLIQAVMRRLTERQGERQGGGGDA